MRNIPYRITIGPPKPDIKNILFHAPTKNNYQYACCTIVAGKGAGKT